MKIQISLSSLRVPISDMRKVAPNIVDSVIDMVKEDSPGRSQKEIEADVEVDISLFLEGQLAEDYPKEAERLEKLLRARADREYKRLMKAKK